MLPLPTLYSVIVYHTDDTEARYLFTCLHDIEASINCTWSKCIGDIIITHDVDAIHVHDKETGKLRVHTQRMALGDICDGPTHF
jgi:hypothetical protein